MKFKRLAPHCGIVRLFNCNMRGNSPSLTKSALAMAGLILASTIYARFYLMDRLLTSFWYLGSRRRQKDELALNTLRLLERRAAGRSATAVVPYQSPGGSALCSALVMILKRLGHRDSFNLPIGPHTAFQLDVHPCRNSNSNTICSQAIRSFTLARFRRVGNSKLKKRIFRS